MKHVSLIAACALAAAAGPVAANDSAKIAQGGVANTALIEQVVSAGNNSATVTQGEGWYSGSGNYAQLVQQGVGNSQIEVFQSGYANEHLVWQHDGYNLNARVNIDSAYYGGGFGEGNTVMIEQSGTDAHAWVEQGNSTYSRAEIWQQGWGGQKFADIFQSGSGNMASVQQMGSGQATILQSGSNLNATITQRSDSYGYGNSAMIRQGY